MWFKNRKWLGPTLVSAVIAAAIIYYFHEERVRRAASPNTAQTEQELEAAKAIAVLPPGTAEPWDSYVDRRIAATLHRTGTTVQLINPINEMLGKTVYVSIYSPYEISCDVLGGSIAFGYSQRTMTSRNGENGDSSDDLSLNIYGVVAEADPTAEKPPPLGVNIQSIAAAKLGKRLCQRIAERMETIFGQQSP
jgi:hypothetical protein